MKRIVAPCIIGLAFLATMMSAAPATAQTGPSSPSAVIDPRVWDRLEREEELTVYISLRKPGTPLLEQTVEERVQHAHAVQESVLRSLTADDFSVTHRFPVTAGLGGRINTTGVEKLAQHPDVLSIEPSVKATLSLGQSVPLINASLIHQIDNFGAGINVAVLDSGVQKDHPKLADSIVYYRCFLIAECGTQDVIGHGTEVTGVIASSSSPTGVAPDAAIYAYKVVALSEDEDLSALAVLSAYNDIIENSLPVDFINMSFNLNDLLASPFSNGNCDVPTQGFVRDITNEILVAYAGEDIVSFAAAGNDGVKTGISFPACGVNTVGVGSVYDADVGVHSAGVCTDNSTTPDQVPLLFKLV